MEHLEFACRWECASHTRLQVLWSRFQTSLTPGAVKGLQDGRAGTQVTSAPKNWLLSLPLALIEAYGCSQRSCSLCSAPAVENLLSAGDATTHLTANVTHRTSQRTKADLPVHSAHPCRCARGKHPLFRRETVSHTDIKLQVTWSHSGKSKYERLGSLMT